AVAPPAGVVVVDPARAERRVVGTQRRRAEPAVPVEAGLHRLLGEVAPAAGGAGEAGVDGQQLAEPAGAHVLAGGAEAPLVLHPLLAAGLEDPAVLAGRLQHG